MTPLSSKPSNLQVLLAVLLLLLLSVGWIEYQVLSYTKGAFVYPEDDAYMRMSIAKHLAFKQIWGISRYEFVPASSSILYPIVLAALYFVFGSHLIIALLVNLAGAVLVLYIVQKWLIQKGITGWGQFFVLTACVFLIPLPVLVVNGMETVWQVFFSFLLVYKFCDWYHSDRPFPRLLFLYTLLLTGLRYEGLFIVLVCCVYLLLRRKWFLSVGLGLTGLLPGVLFGWYSVQHGAYFLPNPILIKCLPMPLVADNAWNILSSTAVDRLLYPYPSRNAVACARLLILIPFFYWLFVKVLRNNGIYRQLLWLTLWVTVLHLIFTNGVFTYRYECYLMACMIPVTGALLVGNLRSQIPERGASARWIAVWIGAFLFLPLVGRSWQAYQDTGKGCINMYEQDHLLATFVHKYYYQQPFIVDDLGAVSYMTEGKKLDLATGIASMPIIKSKEEQYYRPDYLGLIIQGYQPGFAAISEKKNSAYLYSKWKKVARWSTYNYGLFGDPYLNFYAIDPNAELELRKNLEAFERTLPEGVKVEYFH